jgi:hypothetical protein
MTAEISVLKEPAASAVSIMSAGVVEAAAVGISLFVSFDAGVEAGGLQAAAIMRLMGRIHIIIAVHGIVGEYIGLSTFR